MHQVACFTKLKGIYTNLLTLLWLFCTNLFLQHKLSLLEGFPLDRASAVASSSRLKGRSHGKKKRHFGFMVTYRKWNFLVKFCQREFMFLAWDLHICALQESSQGLTATFMQDKMRSDDNLLVMEWMRRRTVRWGKKFVENLWLSNIFVAALLLQQTFGLLEHIKTFLRVNHWLKRRTVKTQFKRAKIRAKNYKEGWWATSSCIFELGWKEETRRGWKESKAKELTGKCRPQNAMKSEEACLFLT